MAATSKSGSTEYGIICSGPPTSSDRLPLTTTATRSTALEPSMAVRSAGPSATKRCPFGIGGAPQLVSTGTTGMSRDGWLIRLGTTHAWSRRISSEKAKSKPCVEAGLDDVRGQLPVAAQLHAGQVELADLVVERPLVGRHPADDPLRHVVVEELVEVVARHDHHGVRVGPREGLLHPLRPGQQAAGVVGQLVLGTPRSSCGTRGDGWCRRARRSLPWVLRTGRWVARDRASVSRAATPGGGRRAGRRRPRGPRRPPRRACRPARPRARSPRRW